MNVSPAPSQRRADQPAPLLEVENLRVRFGGHLVVNGVSFSVSPGEVLGIVGESGSGKSTTALAVMQLIPPNGSIEADRVSFLGEDLLAAGEKRMGQIRGRRIGMIFQEPMTALNPVLSVGSQITETARRHLGIGRREARERAISTMRRVGIPAPERRIDEFPHQLSGGMCQRVVIAMALICNPEVLIADEPTTALDVTIQAQILELMLDLQEEYKMGIVLISHDLGVVSSFTDRVMIMYAGQVVEAAAADEMFTAPRHPYTEGLIASIPPVDADVERLKVIKGAVPPPFDLPPGCRFAPRCEHVRPPCSAAVPDLIAVGAGHSAACIRNLDYRLEPAR